MNMSDTFYSYTFMFKTVQCVYALYMYAIFKRA